MDYQEREFFIYRITAGYTIVDYQGRKIKVHPPSDAVLYEAGLFYKEVYDECKRGGALTEAEMLMFLYSENLWSPDKEERIKELSEGLDDTKVRIYNSIFSAKDAARYKVALREMERELQNLYGTKRVFEVYTCEGISQYAKSQFILEHMARVDGKKCDWQQISLPILFSSLQSAAIQDKVIRYLAHNDPWSGIWSTKKYTKIFKNRYQSDDQRRLISWSAMYDNIYKSPDCPHESIIEDDDTLDGWLIIQKREREKNQKQKRADKALKGKVSGSDEVFIVAQTPEDAKLIHDMNDNSAKRIIDNRKRKMKSSTRDINFTEFEDVRIRLLNEISQGK